jgi:hypothetical protein
MLPGAALSLCLVLGTAASYGGEGEVAEPEAYRIDEYRSPVPKTL